MGRGVGFRGRERLVECLAIQAISADSDTCAKVIILGEYLEVPNFFPMRWITTC